MDLNTILSQTFHETALSGTVYDHFARRTCRAALYRLVDLRLMRKAP